MDTFQETREAITMNNLQLSLALLSEPKKALEELRERPSFWFPLLLIAFGTALAIVVYFQHVDMAWFTDYLGSLDPKMAKAGESVPAMSRDMLMWTSLTAVIISIPIMRMVEAAYYLLAGKVTNLGQAYGHWLALACWSSLPLLLSLVIGLILLFMHPTGQISQEQLNVLSLNELLFHVAPGSKWHTLATTLTLLHPWAWGLAAYGVRVWSGRSWGFSVGFSLLPWAVFYGVWALIAAI